MKKKIIILLGDPVSINSELICKTWKRLPKNLKKIVYIISSFDVLKAQIEKLRLKVKLKKINSIDENLNTNKLKVLNIDLSFEDPFKFNLVELRQHIFKSFDLAHKLALNNKKISGIINCPINKNILNNKGFGVTELLASKCSIKNNTEVMFIRNNKLAVSPITTHIDLKHVEKKISKKLIKAKIKSININFSKIFSKKPRIAILGLNPHNAEFRKNSEECKLIIPSIKYLKKQNIKIFGPFAADTIFLNDYKKYDVIVGMYHDQVLAPFKTLYKFNAINLTLGLKYLRVSPDHGVATNLIGKNKANYSSLYECIKFCNKFG